MAYTEDELEDDLNICEGALSELDLDELDNTEMSMDSQGIVAINVLCTERILEAIHKSQYAENNPETKELLDELTHLKAANLGMREALVKKDEYIRSLEQETSDLQHRCKDQQTTIGVLRGAIEERRL